MTTVVAAVTHSGWGAAAGSGPTSTYNSLEAMSMMASRMCSRSVGTAYVSKLQCGQSVRPRASYSISSGLRLTSLRTEFPAFASLGYHMEGFNSSLVLVRSEVL